ncbi:hypothetical protein [Occallatibacter savannae]|uniref:hypothetical protein n=1 Tax=Occallatibacter savannae TaxID=1002691 RepID=UPI000D691B86|nr:hypothetical protein [Occallatibacter savannae]
MRQLLSRINFAKLFSVLAIALVVSLGACGLTALVAFSRRSGANDAMLPLAIAELVLMVLSAAGLVITFILWVIATIMGVRK